MAKLETLYNRYITWDLQDWNFCKTGIIMIEKVKSFKYSLKSTVVCGILICNKWRTIYYFNVKYWILTYLNQKDQDLFSQPSHLMSRIINGKKIKFDINLLIVKSSLTGDKTSLCTVKDKDGTLETFKKIRKFYFSLRNFQNIHEIYSILTEDTKKWEKKRKNTQKSET